MHTPVHAGASSWHTLHLYIEPNASIRCRACEELAWARKAQEETGRRAEALAAAEARAEATSRDLERRTAQLQVTVRTLEAAEGCYKHTVCTDTLR